MTAEPGDTFPTTFWDVPNHYKNIGSEQVIIYVTLAGVERPDVKDLIKQLVT
ncbi:hypothetical protein PMIT1320_00649 [Prochlorococcus marinus str. MIT 1320]|nr:hypothetical protein PMIT1320_00649 [Prochlorococcus marinus str. MIT 1320]